MADTVIAAQLYTLRAHTKTPADIAKTLHKVKAIGYDAVQLSALGPIEPQQLRRYLDEAGLVACASHVSFEQLRDSTQQVIEENQLLNCAFVALSSAPHEYRSRDGYHRLAHELSELARPLVEAGLVFSYHNHSFELERYGSKTGLEILFDEADPGVVTAEIDTYWIQHGGGDPAEWIRRLSGRVPLVHLKDMGVYGNEPTFAEVGEGNLNWPAIMAACQAAGMRWYIVEQDECRRDPFESLRISLHNLRAMGLG